VRGRGRQRGIAQANADVLWWQAECVGRYLGDGRVSPRAHVAACRLDESGAIGKNASARACRAPERRIGGGCHTPSDQQLCVTHRLWLRAAPRPAEAFSGAAIAFPQGSTREREALIFVECGFVLHRNSIGSIPSSIASSSIADSSAKMPLDSPGPRICVGVRADSVCARSDMNTSSAAQWRFSP
jgi:hypothetical protein